MVMCKITVLSACYVASVDSRQKANKNYGHYKGGAILKKLGTIAFQQHHEASLSARNRAHGCSRSD